jgi:GNAT superfamily N-acetyltransferase
MVVLIRDFAAADRDRVNAVALAAFAQYEAHYDDWAAFSDGVKRMAELAAPANGADLIVAERDGIVVGAVAHIGPGAPRSPIYPDDWSVIRMLVVDPGERSTGIGRRLVAACLQRARAGGAPVIGLHTSPIMGHALALYTRIGFAFDCDLAPIRGVPYARYVLSREAIPTALARLAR